MTERRATVQLHWPASSAASRIPTAPLAIAGEWFFWLRPEEAIRCCGLDYGAKDSYNFDNKFNITFRVDTGSD